MRSKKLKKKKLPLGKITITRLDNREQGAVKGKRNPDYSEVCSQPNVSRGPINSCDLECASTPVEDQNK